MSKKLLLADDSITIQKVIGITFANEDYELIVVDNGDAALEKARSEVPDLILADVFMPGRNGYELCAAVRQDPALRGVPVLLLTGTFEPFDENKARAAGADSWIAKPFESQALIDRVEELLARPPQPAAPPAETPTAAAAAPATQAAAAAAEADIWGDLAEPGAAESEAGPPGGFFFGEAPVAEPESAAPPAAQDAAAAEDDIWGAVIFDEEDLLVGEPGEESAEDIWGSMDEEEPVGVTGETFAVADEPPAVTAVPPAPEEFVFEEEEELPPVATPPALDEFVFEEEEEPFAPAAAGMPGVPEEEEEEDILPLDEFDILDEEDLEELAASPAEEAFVFAAEEAFPAAAPEAPGEEQLFDFAEEAAAGEPPIAFEEEFPLAEEGPEWGIAEEPAAAVEPASPAAGEVFITPAAAAMEPVQAAAPVAAAAVEERVRALSEEELASIVERVAGAVIERLAGSVLERIAWEVVPDLAENLVKEEIRKIKEEAQ